MIFVSSACVTNKFIGDSVKQLAEQGFVNIELSGGTRPYDNLEADLLRLKKEFNLNYLCHNYFPPPTTPFVINLASLDEEIFDLTYRHIKNAIQLSKVLGADKYGFHAGFLINIPLNQIGKPIEKQALFDREPALKKFITAFKKLQEEHPGIQLYLENNVLSSQNLENFKNENPLFMCDLKGYDELKQKIDFGLILDVAHLKVSCNSLNLNFDAELNRLFSYSDYIHISDNDGLSDSNGTFKKNSDLFGKLKKLNFKNKITTIEVYGSMQDLLESYESVKALYV